MLLCQVIVQCGKGRRHSEAHKTVKYNRRFRGQRYDLLLRALAWQPGYPLASLTGAAHYVLRCVLPQVLHSRSRYLGGFLEAALWMFNGFRGKLLKNLTTPDTKT